MKASLCGTLIAGLFAVASQAGAHEASATPNTVAQSASAVAAASGIDVAAMDTGVRAQDDFFRYTQGKWLKDVDIPSDRSSWSTFSIAQERVEQQVSAIIGEAAAQKNAKAGSEAQKMGDFYNSYVDEKRRNELGLAPLKGELARIKGIKDKRDMAALMAHFERIGAAAPFGMGVGQDNRDSTRYIVGISQSGLGMPNRDYYLQVKRA